VDYRSRSSSVDAEAAFVPIRQIGGKNGWYFATWLWAIRGRIDALLGGVGLRRGRRDPDSIRVGDSLDFWRVEIYEPDRRLRLRAEMKLPGRAWLEFEVTEEADGTRVHQTAIFDPKGLFGQLYWYLLFPLHVIIFRGMLRQVVARGAAGVEAQTAAGKSDRQTVSSVI
jgi:hypothetical protein